MFRLNQLVKIEEVEFAGALTTRDFAVGSHANCRVRQLATNLTLKIIRFGLLNLVTVKILQASRDIHFIASHNRRSADAAT